MLRIDNAWITTCMLHVHLEYSPFSSTWFCWDTQQWQFNLSFHHVFMLRYVLFHCVFLYLLGESCMQMWDLMQAVTRTAMPNSLLMKADPKTGGTYASLVHTFVRVGQPQSQPQSHCRPCLLFVYITFIRTSCNIIIASHVLFHRSTSFHIIPYQSMWFIIGHDPFHESKSISFHTYQSC